MMITGDDRNETQAPNGQRPDRPEKTGPGITSPAQKTLRRKAAPAPFDPWADWKPQWQALQHPTKPHETKSRGKSKKPKAGSAGKNKPSSPHDIQERHSPTQTVTTRLDATRRQEHHQRRIVDARLWDSMSAPQQSAALEIARAFETMGKGLGYVTSDWTRIPGCSGPHHAAEMHSRLIEGYIDWTKRCHKQKLSHSMVIDILVYGFTCRALDRDRRVRAGAARENLLAGLSLYCALRGWPDK